jgi:cell pole-organizing protein PopZ
MSEAKSEHEPSMEEILASIRRIIAEDGDAASVPGAPPSAGAGQRHDEVLELTEVVEEDGSVVSIGAKPAVAEPAPPPTPKPPPQPAFEPPPQPAFDPSVFEKEDGAPAPRDAEADERLISSAAAAASVAALSQLAVSRSSGRGGDLAIGGGRTLEDLVCEMLRPLLKTWLDDNLPQLVERLVQEEIGRLVRDAQGR